MKNIQNNPPNNNVHISNNPQVIHLNSNPNVAKIKKRESDHKEIADFFKKDKVGINPFSRNSDKELPKPNLLEKVEKDLKNINSNFPQNIFNNVANNSDDKTTPLREFLKKKREEMKNKEKLADVIWLNNDKKEQIRGEEKMIKMPKIIILDKNAPQKKDSSENLSINSASNSNKKGDLEFYNVNRCLNEMAKIANDEDDSIDTNEEEKQICENVNEKNEEREENIIDDNTNISEELKPTFDSNTDYSQIEELKIDLEQILGMDLFKRIYKLVDSNVIVILFNFRLIINYLNVILS